MNEFLRAFVKNKKPHIALTLLQDMEKSHLYESKPTEDSFLIIMSSIDQTQQLYFLQQILHEMIRFQVYFFLYFNFEKRTFIINLTPFLN